MLLLSLPLLGERRCCVLFRQTACTGPLCQLSCCSASSCNFANVWFSFSFSLGVSIRYMVRGIGPMLLGVPDTLFVSLKGLCQLTFLSLCLLFLLAAAVRLLRSVVAVVSRELDDVSKLKEEEKRRNKNHVCRECMMVLFMCVCVCVCVCAYSRQQASTETNAVQRTSKMRNGDRGGVLFIKASPWIRLLLSLLSLLSVGASDRPSWPVRKSCRMTARIHFV